MPFILQPRSANLYICAALVLVALALVSRGCIFRPGTDFTGSHFNRGSNAIWLDITWVKDPHEAEHIAALANDLERRQIRHVFAYATYLKPSGDFNPTYSHAAEFVRGIKGAQPDLDIQAWIGLPLNQQAFLSPPGHVDIRDPSTRLKIAEFTADLLREGGFDGIHLDPEPVTSDNNDLLALLQDVRNAIGPGTTLSIATRRIWPVFSDSALPYSAKMAWRGTYYREVARRVDQMAVMTYDSSMPDPQLYRLWSRFQVIEITRAVDGTGVDLFFGIPTSEERTRTHWPAAENVTSGLEGLIDGLNDSAARPTVFTGVAIYPDWDTDASEWLTFERLWLGR